MAISALPPSGFRDFPPEESLRRGRILGAIYSVYRSFGFEPISTSAVEDLAVLLGKGGGENEKLIFKILKRGDKLAEARETGGELADLGLRFDLTLPLARFYAKHGGALPRPFKVFQMGPVWRAERAQKGRYREFFQCDADIIGSESALCEIEIISVILAAFRELGLDMARMTALLNDRRLLYAVLDRCGVPQELHGRACVIIDKADKVPEHQIQKELQELTGPSLDWERLRGYISSAPPDGVLREAGGSVSEELIDIRDQLRAMHGDRPAVLIRPGLARGLDYYTGPIFEFRYEGFSGSLGGGGRYDRLTEKFGTPQVPACGASIGFERLLLALEGTQGARGAEGPQCCVLVFDERLRGDSLALALALRRKGLRVDLYTGTGSLKAQFKYADAKKAPCALLIGPEEKARGLVKVKDLGTGAETLEAPESLASRLSR